MNIELADDALRWYVIQTQRKQEQRAEDNLRAWMVETFYPKLKEARYNRYTGQRADIIKPLFPSYIFARFKARALLHKIHFTRGVSKVVNFGSGPASVDDEVLSLLKENLEQDGYIRFQNELKKGDKVVVNDGPLKDFSGIFEREMPASQRVSILLSTANYQGHLVVDRRFVAKVHS